MPGGCKIEMQTLPSGYTIRLAKIVGTVRVPHLSQEPHLGRVVRVVIGECQGSLEESTL